MNSAIKLLNLFDIFCEFNNKDMVKRVIKTLLKYSNNVTIET
jgi:hypothetical protein